MRWEREVYFAERAEVESETFQWFSLSFFSQLLLFRFLFQGLKSQELTMG